MGVVADPALGRGYADLVQQFDGCIESVPALQPLVQAQHLGDLLADAQHRVERGSYNFV